MKRESCLFLLKRNRPSQPAGSGPPRPPGRCGTGGVSPGIPPSPPTRPRRLGRHPEVLGTFRGTAWMGGCCAPEPQPGLGEVSVLPAPCAPMSPRWASLPGTGLRLEPVPATPAGRVEWGLCESDVCREHRRKPGSGPGWAGGSHSGSGSASPSPAPSLLAEGAEQLSVPGLPQLLW